ncbi:MAG: hypothetical protein LC776_03530 [Acidobacteria bacterium]|nr:hypothetical protein [Acidobacteriota bacterium]
MQVGPGDATDELVWVPNWSSASCDLGVFVDQPAEPVVTLEATVGW